MNLLKENEQKLLRQKIFVNQKIETAFMWNNEEAKQFTEKFLVDKQIWKSNL
jgi:hypothetical protein